MAGTALKALPTPDAPFAGGGVCGELINSFDWSSTPLGPISSWPASLRTIVGTMLRSRHPMFLWWGPELIQIYNDAYVPSFGKGKHPAAMGQRGEDCWDENWPIIGPQIDDVMRHGRSTWNEDHLVPIFRNGRVEEAYWTYSFSPVCDERDHIAGTLVVCTEPTAAVIAERRLKTIRELSDATSPCQSVASIAAAALEVLQRSALDVPFALLYGSAGGLEASVGLDGTPLRAFDDGVRQALRDCRDNCTITLPDGIAAPGGPWPEPSTRAFVSKVQTGRLGTLVFGLSPRLPFDSAYREFLTAFVRQVEMSAARVEAFGARAAAEAERRNLLLQAPVATALLIGPQHVFELANPAYRRVIGGRDVVGKTYDEAIPELADAPIGAVLDHVYETGEPFVAEEYPVLLDRRGNGILETCFFKFSLEPLRNETGVYGMMVVALDITEQVDARHELERTNAERQRLLAQLESASRAKDEFLATVSHELRTPLNAMLGWANLLRTSSMSAEKQHRALETIERNARAQSQLIEDLLDVSRIISGKLRLEMSALDLASIIDAALESVRLAAEAKGVRIHVFVEEQARQATGDPQRLQQVVWNLVSNAVKFTDEGGVVTVRLSRAGAEVQLVVSDTGRGVDAEFLPHIFERFKQANGTTTRPHGGLGLGLAIVKHLVELHGGRVEAESAGPGHGASFQVNLPLSRSILQAAEDAEPPASQEAATPKLDGLRVLVVDDEVDALALLVELLERQGAIVTSARSAAEALLAVESRPPDVIVSDIGMPGEDGYSLIRKVRALAGGGRKAIPAVALTAYARSEDRTRALLSGFHHHIAKPVEPAELVIVVATLAGRID